ncbi:hypothetical protein CROQUDRAFT_89778 [Cronartium quercuum f. sp. fusiforme G11]|uniref:Uncharacterized protein n=1 Tax=Cronartium quercuum f. sp. fusiforme G11 TaxID=708437 RepID=A0A9P6TEK8_9BASI|nr:hypothetical protein CROQUDRAFT_89778 [Cronartium quercuum f. sp. fusiforme G11]
MDSKAEKQSEIYVQKFLGLNSAGEEDPVPMQDWEQTKKKTVELWGLVHYSKQL